MKPYRYLIPCVHRAAKLEGTGITTSYQKLRLLM
jgi:hypothetical protein